MTAVVLLFCGPASAHDVFGNSRSMLTGALHVVTSPLALAAMGGLIAALMGIGEAWSLGCAGVAGVSAAATAALPGHFAPFVAPAAVVVVGLSASAGLHPKNVVAAMLALFAGAATGIAADLDAPSAEGVIGVAGTVLFIVGGAVAGLEDLSRLPRLSRVLPIGRRVLGSWVAAIGLLLGALAVKTAA
jgi:hypothetical protein